MEWGANPQRAGHCNVEPLPGESSHWRKLRRRERAKKRSQDTFCVESPRAGSVLQYPHKTMVLRGFLFTALHQYSSQSVPKLKISGPSFAKGGEPSPPASFLKNQQHEIIRQHAQCQLAADSFFSFFCKEKALINIHIRAFSYAIF